MKPLSELKINTPCKVVSIETQNLQLRRRILDMGITPGVELVIVKTAPFGDPFEIKIRGYSLSFRKADATGIIVEEV